MQFRNFLCGVKPNIESLVSYVLRQYGRGGEGEGGVEVKEEELLRFWLRWGGGSIGSYGLAPPAAVLLKGTQQE